jgi:hypothetical protein
MPNTITLGYRNQEDIERAAAFIAQLVREGLAFSVAQREDALIVTTTGF